MAIHFYKTFEWIGIKASHEIKLAGKRLTRSHGFKSLHHLFQRATSYLSPKKPAPSIPKSKLEGFDLLDHEVTGLFPKTSKIQGTSELKKNHDDTSLKNCSVEALHYFSGTNKKKWLKNPEKIFTFLGEFSLKNLSVNPLSTSMKENYFAGLQRRLQFQQCLHQTFERTEFQTEEEIRQQTLKDLAVDFQQQSADLEKGASWFYFGELTSQSHHFPHLIDQQFKKSLPPTIYELIKNSQGDSSVFLRNEIIKQLKEHGLIDPNSEKTQIEILWGNTLQKIEDQVCRLLPKSWYKKIAENLNEDLHELLINPKKKNEVGERLWKSMNEGGLFKTVDTVIKDNFSSCQHILQEGFESVKHEIASQIPNIMLQGLSTAGINLTPAEKFFFELKKQQDDKYSLVFFSNDLLGSLHPQIKKGKKEGRLLPLVFNDIPKEKLDLSFFSLLLSYEARPFWEKDVTYSLENLYESLSHLLEIDPESANEKTIYPESTILLDDPVDWSKLYIHHACGDKQVDFQQLYQFDLPYQLLVNLWPQISTQLENSDIRHSLKSLIHQLSEKALTFCEEENLSNIHCTLEEVRTQIKCYETRSNNEKRISSVVIPKPLESLMEGLAVALSITSDNVELLKETLVELLGPEIENSFDALLHQVLPKLAEAKKIETRAPEISWQEVLGIENVKAFFDNITKIRCSPLHAYRLYTQLSSVYTIFLGFSIKANLIEALILATCPWIGAFLPFSITYAARAISIFGLPILKKILPSNVYTILESLYFFVNEVMSYCLQRIGILVLKNLIHHFTPLEDIQKSIKSIEQDVTRHGKIDYAVKPSDLSSCLQVSVDPHVMIEKNPGYFRLKPNPPTPTRIDLTSKNIHTTVEDWINFIKNGYKDQEPSPHLVIPEETAMHRLIRDLPIPGQKGSEIWEEVEEPLKMIRKLNELLIETHRLTNGMKKKLSRYDISECVTTDYTLYAIIDTLARRCPDTHLTPEIKPNGIGLAIWLGRPYIHITNSLTNSKLIEVAKYFGIDPCKRYTDEDCLDYEKNRLFQIYHTKNCNVKGILDFYKMDIIKEPLKINVVQFISSPEGKYYQSLLKDNSIQEKLANFGSHLEDSDHIIMLLLDGHHSLGREVELLGDNNLEEKKEKPCWALPEAFFYLRSAYFLTRLSMDHPYQINDSNPKLLREPRPLFNYRHTEILDRRQSSIEKILDRSFGGGIVIKDELSLPVKVLLGTANLTISPLKKIMRYFETFSHPCLTNVAYPSYLPSQLHFSCKFFGNPYVYANPFMNQYESHTSVMATPNQQPQYEIMAKTGRNCQRSNDMKIIQMINTDSADQVMRILSHMTLNKALLLDPLVRVYLYFWAQHLTALEMQIKERPKIIQDFGLFFTEMLNYFEEKKEYAVCLYLADIGNSILNHCQRHDPKAVESFPNFHVFIDTKIVQAFRGKDPEDRNLTISRYWLNKPEDGLVLSLISLVSSYHEVDPTVATAQQKRNVVKAILRLKCCRTSWLWKQEKFDVVLKCTQVMSIWGPHIKETMDNHNIFSFNVLDSIMLDAGIDSLKRHGSTIWEGSYPHFTKGDLSVDFERLTSYSSIKIKEKRQLILEKTGIVVTGGYVIFPEKIVFNEENIEIDGSKILRYINGKKFRCLDTNEVTVNNFKLSEEHLWIEEREDTPKKLIVLQTRGNDIVNRYLMEMKGESNNYELIEIEGHPLEKIPMKQSLGLDLLKWFQKPSDIELYVSHAHNPPQLKNIVFKNLDLHFEIRSIKGEAQAVAADEHTPGFYISKTQYHPHLLSYGQYLLLENEQKECRVHLVAFPWKHLSGLFLLNHIGQISTSPYIEKCVNDFLESSATHYTYTLNDEGRLESEDPVANLYLMYLHLAKGEDEQCFHYLQCIEDLGKQSYFTPIFANLMHLCMMVLLLKNSPQVEKVYLRLTAIFKENSDKQADSILPKSSTVITWITKLIKYNNYLKNVENRGEEYLSIYQEKMILNAIDEDLEKIITMFSNKKHRINTLITLVAKNSKEYLTISRIASRAHMLKKQTEKGSSWKAGEFLQHLLFDTTSPKAPQIPNITNSAVPLINKIAQKIPGVSEWTGSGSSEKKEEWIPYLLNIYKRFDDCKIADKWEYPHEGLSRYYLIVSTDLLEMTPSVIAENFLYFYHLAANVLPAHWKGDIKLENRFALQVKEFRRHFLLIQGKFQKNSHKQAMAVLKMVLRKAKNYEHPHKLEKMTPEDFIKTMNILLSKNNDLSSKVINSLDVDKLSYKKVAKKISQVTCQTGIFLGKNLFLGSFARNYNFTKTSINLGLKLGFGIYHSVKKIHQKNVESENKVIQRQRSSTIHHRDLLPESLQQIMQQREGAIDHIMDEFLSTYFDIREKELPPQEKPKENNSSDIYQEYNDLVSSLKSYDDRPQEKLYTYTLKVPPSDDKKPVKNENDRFKELREDLVNLEKDTDQQLKKERHEIEKLVNISLKNSHRQTLLSHKPKAEKMTFEEIDNLFIQENDHKLCEQFKMSATQLEHLKKRLYLYHVLASRWNLLFACLPKCEELTPQSLELMGRELQRRRVYRLEGSEWLARGKVVFESRTKKMLWEKQSLQIDKVLLSDHWRLVVELIMGSGKTWYGIPMTNYFCANGQQLVINIWPPALATTNIKEISRQARKIFNQTATSFEITRDMPWKQQFGRVLTHIFERALSQKEQLNSTKESLQSMELSFIEQSIAERCEAKGDESMLNSLWETLKMTRFSAIGCPDEGHKVFDRKKELNYPLGEKKWMSDKHVAIMTKAIFLLGSISHMSEILSLKGKRPSPLEIATYEDKILSQLAEKFMDFDLDKNNRDEFKAYISGKSESVPTWIVDHPQRSEIAMIRGILTFLFPESLRQTTHVDYNPSKTSGNDYVQPSDCNDNTIETANIESPYETYIKTGLLLLQDRLSKPQTLRLIKYLQNKAKGDAKSLGIDEERTSAGKFFSTYCTGYTLKSFDEKDLDDIHSLLYAHDEVIMLYLESIVAPQITYYAYKLSSNSSNFGSMFSKFISDTGTPFNKGSFPHDTTLLNDPGVDGESIRIMEEKCSDPTTIQILELPLDISNEKKSNIPSPEEALELLIDNYFDKDHTNTALIDRGAVLNGMSSLDVARRLLKYIDEKRQEMKAIAFYYQNELMILEKGASKPVPISQSTVSPKHRLSYFPQPQTFAADIPQPEGAQAIVTIGADITFNELAQAIWRMRGLKKNGQRLIFVMTPDVRKAISGDKIPTIQDIILFAKRNEQRHVNEDNYEADKQKMHDIVRRAILDKAFKAPNLKKTCKILRDFKDFFITKVEDDPYLLFGKIRKEIDPLEVFKALRKKYRSMIKNTDIFDLQEKSDLKLKLKQIGHGDYPKTVKVHCDKNNIQEDTFLQFNKQSQIQMQNKTEVREEVRHEQQAQIKINLIQSEQRQKSYLQEFIPWPKNLRPTALDTWLRIAPLNEYKRLYPTSTSSLLTFGKSTFDDYTHLASLKSVLNHMNTSHSCAVAEKVSSRILVSPNFVYRGKSFKDLEVYGPLQIPTFEVLVIKKNEEDLPYIILIDQREASYWRDKLREDRKMTTRENEEVKIGLYDVTTGFWAAEGYHCFNTEDKDDYPFKPKKTDQLFKRMIVQLKFLRGDVEYPKEKDRTTLKTWLSKDVENMFTFFKSVYAYHSIKPFEGSHIESIIESFNVKPKEKWQL